MYHECRHIMPSGKKCHSPALQNQVYCYYHNNLHRYSRPAASDNLSLFALEDNRGIQIALTQVLTALNSPHLDTRRAGLMLYGLQIAAQLANRTSDLEPYEAVRTCEETTGAPLAPEKTVCEPSSDCRNCPRQHTCGDYEDPEEDESEEDAVDSEDNEECEDDDLEDDEDADECNEPSSDAEDDKGDEDEGEEEEDEEEAASIRSARAILAT